MLLAALSTACGHYFYARAEPQKAADAGLPVAAQEVDAQICRNEGRIVLNPSAAGVASSYATLNSGYRAARGICPRITGIAADQRRRTVSISMAADASALFPSALHGITVQASGEAELPLKSRP